MADSTFKEKPNFLGQALLIVLPVLILATVGLHSLREDKILAHREAAESAQALADALVPQLWASLTSQAQQQLPRFDAFQIDGTGRLTFPPPIAPWPIPKPFAVAALTADQAHLWQTAQRSEAQRSNTAAAEAYKAFLELHPPPDFAAGATYSLGLVLAERGDVMGAAELFQALIAKQPEAAAESGLPLQPLAQLKLLGWLTNISSGDRIISINAFCSNVVYRPTPLTPALLQQALDCSRFSGAAAVFETWMQLWEQHERIRRMYVVAAQNFRQRTIQSSRQGATDVVGETGRPDEIAPRLFWFTLGETVTTNSLADPGIQRNQPGNLLPQRRLALRCQESSAGCWFICQTESNTITEMESTAARAVPTPQYFGVELKVAGRRFTCFKPATIPRAAVDLRIAASGRQPDRPSHGEITVPTDIAISGLPDPELLCAAGHSENGMEWLRVNVYLTNPAAFYARQRTRRFWFGSLIAISAAAALTGLVAAWRAFQRQQRLSELKSNFVSSVSHELRAPVASVRLLAESLERGAVSDPPKQREYFRLIGQECRRLSALIENVLDFSRIEQGRKQYEFEPTDLVALVEQTVKGMEPCAAERQVTLAVSFPNGQVSSPPPQPVLDGRAIQQALVNLIDNAIKHSPGGRTVTVGLDWPPYDVPSIKCAPGQPSLVALWVEDRGGGIPPEEHEKIFERFYRRGSELHRETQGIGIGLSIVKHIVEAHGGKVRVRSAIGEGSRFWIELPVIQQARQLPS